MQRRQWGAPSQIINEITHSHLFFKFTFDADKNPATSFFVSHRMKNIIDIFKKIFYIKKRMTMTKKKAHLQDYQVGNNINN